MKHKDKKGATGDTARQCQGMVHFSVPEIELIKAGEYRPSRDFGPRYKRTEFMGDYSERELSEIYSNSN